MCFFVCVMVVVLCCIKVTVRFVCMWRFVSYACAFSLYLGYVMFVYEYDIFCSYPSGFFVFRLQVIVFVCPKVAFFFVCRYFFLYISRYRCVLSTGICFFVCMRCFVCVFRWLFCSAYMWLSFRMQVLFSSSSGAFFFAAVFILFVCMVCVVSYSGGVYCCIHMFFFVCVCRWLVACHVQVRCLYSDVVFFFRCIGCCMHVLFFCALVFRLHMFVLCFVSRLLFFFV